MASARQFRAAAACWSQLAWCLLAWQADPCFKCPGPLSLRLPLPQVAQPAGRLADHLLVQLVRNGVCW